MKENIILFAGVVGGLSLALWSLLGGGQQGLPDYAVARVNDQFITADVYERAVSAMARDKRAALTDEDRRHILNRLIDEELLLQYGLQQGLVRSDRQVKSTLIGSVLQAKRLQAEVVPLPEKDVRAFFNENQSLFSQTSRVRCALIRVPVTDERGAEAALQRAQEAVERLRKGEPLSLVQTGFHEGGAMNLPDTPLPYNKLLDYLGPTLADQAFALNAGETAEPLFVGQAWQVLHVLDRVVQPVAEFGEVRPLVEAEMRRREAENLLRSTLDVLRASESVVVTEALR